MEYVINILKNNTFKKFMLFSFLLIGYLTFEVIYLIIGIDFTNITKELYILLSLIKYIFFMLLLILIYRKYLKEKWKDFRINFKKYAKISVKDWFTGFIIMIIANVIISNYITGLGENEAAVQTIIVKLPLMAFFMTTLFAPFNEEMIFRKSLQDVIKNKYLYMILSGFIFGLVHVIGSNNPYEYLLIISYGALGFMFAHTINKTDNIFCTIMMHMFHNGVLTILAMVI